ncbi:MAG TPA: NADH-quinone oxidoreductase subunit J [Candidatus Dormibacteraeota bacterium]|nr:NADH-quinone oxidoreductase subunit J [Candidatus Dormibacteraeota bacterium]
MTGPVIVFFALAALALGGAVSLILRRHPIHSALSLIVVMVALAGLYLLLGAEFVAAVQVIVYGGAIMVLFVFVIMLLNAGIEERTNLSRMAGLVGLPLGFFLTMQLVYWVAHSESQMNAAGIAAGGSAASTRDLAVLLFRDFVFPFELTSFLILIAIIAALVLAQKES